jgi:hypothetical protein
LFETVESWSSSKDRCFITGQIHFSRLKESIWWKKAGVALIVQPKGIVDIKCKILDTKYHLIDEGYQLPEAVF